MNRERFERIIASIEAHPENWNQRTFASWPELDKHRFNEEIDPTACGTTLCIAGWARAHELQDLGIPVTWNAMHPDESGIEHLAAAWLGITRREAYELFFTYQWTIEDLKAIAGGASIEAQAIIAEQRES